MLEKKTYLWKLWFFVKYRGNKMQNCVFLEILCKQTDFPHSKGKSRYGEFFPNGRIKAWLCNSIQSFIFFQADTVTNPTIWLVLGAVWISLSLTTVTVTLAWVFLREFFFRLRAWKKINKLFNGLGSVRIVYGPPSRQITYIYTISFFYLYRTYIQVSSVLH